MVRYKVSNAMLAAHLRHTPGGAQTRSRMAQQFVEGAFPAFASRAEGCYLWDVDDNRYVDFIMGLGAVGIGYGAFFINESSPTLSLPHSIEITYAKALLGELGWPHQVRFVKTGSEATEGAMRIARVATGREVVISVGYHGWHTMHDAASDQPVGVPTGACAAMCAVPYNDLDALAEALGHGSPKAAVLVEPVLHEAPRLGYLAGVRRLCSKHGAVLIFDEVVCGFRWALGGATEYFGVTPDLACFGKAMANGWPLGAIVGRRDLMETGGRFVSGTFGGARDALEAAQRTLSTYHDEPIIARIWQAGITLKTLVSSLFRVEGYDCKPFITTADSDPDRILMSLLLQEAALEGVLLHPTSLNVSAAHTPEVMADALDRLERAVRRVEAWGPDPARLAGLPIRPVFKRT